MHIITSTNQQVMHYINDPLPHTVRIQINNRVYYLPLEQARGMARKWGGAITSTQTIEA